MNHCMIQVVTASENPQVHPQEALRRALNIASCDDTGLSSHSPLNHAVTWHVLKVPLSARLPITSNHREIGTALPLKTLGSRAAERLQKLS